MELRHVRYFLSVAEASSFSRAAARLHVTQPTLSHQLKQLETELGSILIDRAGRRVRLTPSGEVFREYAERVIKEVNSATLAVSEFAKLAHGRLTVGVAEALSSSLLPPLLSEYLKIYPGVHVTVSQLPSRQLEEQLGSNNLDLGIGYSPPATPKIIGEDLFTEPLVLIVGNNHPLAHRNRIQMAMLARTPLLLLTADFPSRQLLEKYFASVDMKPRVVVEVNSVHAALAMVNHTNLATILIKRMAASVPGLHCVDLVPSIIRTVALLWRRAGYRTVAARALADLIKQRVSYVASAVRNERQLVKAQLTSPPP